MGSLIFQIPFTIIIFNVANLALCGFFFLSGFYSKDIILDVSSFYLLNLVSYFLFFFSTGLTVCYTIRLIYFSIFIRYYSWHRHSLNDTSFIIRLSILGLFFYINYWGMYTKLINFSNSLFSYFAFIFEINSSISLFNWWISGLLFI